MTTEPNNTDHSPDAGNSVKRAYIKPAFSHEQVFETMALACGKIDTTQAACSGFNAQSS